jgi:hypothetical protein
VKFFEWLFRCPARVTMMGRPYHCEKYRWHLGFHYDRMGYLSMVQWQRERREPEAKRPVAYPVPPPRPVNEGLIGEIDKGQRRSGAT